MTRKTSAPNGIPQRVLDVITQADVLPTAHDLDHEIVLVEHRAEIHAAKIRRTIRRVGRRVVNGRTRYVDFELASAVPFGAETTSQWEVRDTQTERRLRFDTMSEPDAYRRVCRVWLLGEVSISQTYDVTFDCQAPTSEIDGTGCLGVKVRGFARGVRLMTIRLDFAEKAGAVTVYEKTSRGVVRQSVVQLAATKPLTGFAEAFLLERTEGIPPRTVVAWERGSMEVSHPQLRKGASNLSLADVGVITMKEEEYGALLRRLDPKGTHKGEYRDYDLARIKVGERECRVAVTRCLQQGNLAAHNAAVELIADLRPTFILVVGIAGAVPTVDFGLGDVVVSNYIQDLTLEDTGTDTQSRRFNALGGPLHPTASRIAERLLAIEETAECWNSPSAVGIPRPALGGAPTTRIRDWNKAIGEALDVLKERQVPKATARKVISSDRLVKDPELLKQWRSVLKDVGVVEMESAGVYLACQRSNTPVLAVRGVSDIVGWKRDEGWTRYACNTAAAYTLMLIRAGVFLPW